MSGGWEAWPLYRHRLFPACLHVAVVSRAAAVLHNTAQQCTSAVQALKKGCHTLLFFRLATCNKLLFGRVGMIDDLAVLWMQQQAASGVTVHACTLLNCTSAQDNTKHSVSPRTTPSRQLSTSLPFVLQLMQSTYQQLLCKYWGFNCGSGTTAVYTCRLPLPVAAD